ncbi:CLUMA_CG010226, isoform A [Clunio marinus]|uniref:CLUMA_CG010226, isoform A n=1 Tax=Clunio marinus TaxID=568069 RepID=A0A1J1IAU2_9DIPT|nr:CLUMA_CG010226, isoform A [Clunio marinus]
MLYESNPWHVLINVYLSSCHLPKSSQGLKHQRKKKLLKNFKNVANNCQIEYFVPFVEISKLLIFDTLIIRMYRKCKVRSLLYDLILGLT